MSRCQEECPAPDAAGIPLQYAQTSASSAGMQPAQHARRARQAGSGQGRALQPLRDSHRNFQIVRQPQKLSKEQSSVLQQIIHSKHFPPKEVTE